MTESQLRSAAPKGFAVGLAVLLWGVLFCGIGLFLLVRGVSQYAGLLLLGVGIFGALTGLAGTRSIRSSVFLLQAVSMLGVFLAVLLVNIEADALGVAQIRERFWDAIAAVISLVLAALAFWEFVQLSSLRQLLPTAQALHEVPTAHLHGIRVPCSRCGRSFVPAGHDARCPYCKAPARV